MNCAQHLQTSAMGICKNCSRGLCQDCAVDEGFGLACKNSCEAEVKAVWQLIERNKQVSLRTSAVYLRMAALYGLMAAFFLVFQLVVKSVPVEIEYLFNGFGVLCLVGSFFQLVNANRMKSLNAGVRRSK
jgi:hypothetical protein